MPEIARSSFGSGSQPNPVSMDTVNLFSCNKTALNKKKYEHIVQFQSCLHACDVLQQRETILSCGNYQYKFNMFFDAT